MKTIFLGTPEFAIPSLEALLQTPWIKVLAVCTQTDKQAGRGKHIKMPAVKNFALKSNLMVFQTEKISKEKETIKKIKELEPDVLVSCSYGQILSTEILELAPHGVINVHASILPKYRGAAPINWAILNGEKETGITIMKTELSLDSGPVILQEKCLIDDNETSIELSKKLSVIGANTLIKALELIKSGKATLMPQNHSQETKAPSLKKEIGQIDWTQSTPDIHNKIRGLQPWPTAYTHFNGKLVKIWESRVPEQESGVRSKESEVRSQRSETGIIIEISDYIKVRTKDFCLNIYKLQTENKNIVNAKDWVNGVRAKIGNKFY